MRFFCEEASCERKLLKRQGYGKAGFDLLRARMLAA
jgi:transposase